MTASAFTNWRLGLLRACLLGLLPGLGDIISFLEVDVIVGRKSTATTLSIPESSWLSQCAFEVLCYKSH